MCYCDQLPDDRQTEDNLQQKRLLSSPKHNQSHNSKALQPIQTKCPNNQRNATKQNKKQGLQKKSLIFDLFSLLLIAFSNPVLQSEEAIKAHQREEISLASTMGYPDTQEAGLKAARIDIQKGEPKFMLFGLVAHSTTQNLTTSATKVEYRLGGCLIGGPGYQFWRGYNSEILKAKLITS